MADWRNRRYAAATHPMTHRETSSCSSRLRRPSPGAGKRRGQHAFEQSYTQRDYASADDSELYRAGGRASGGHCRSRFVYRVLFWIDQFRNFCTRAVYLVIGH